MAVSYSYKSIVTDGLVFNVDAANPRSYTSGSTTTDSLIGSFTGSLKNDVSFSSSYQGFWNFDGIDDRLEINELTDIRNSLANSSFNIWVYPNQLESDSRRYQWSFTVDGNYPVVGLSYSPPTNPSPSYTYSGSYDVLSGTSGANRFILVTTGSIFQKEWTNICVTKETGGNTGNKYNCKIYVNGIDQNTNLTDDTATDDWWLDNQALTRFNFATLYRPSVTSKWSVTNISEFSVYNRTLTATEVLQNYNALKDRFT